MTNQVVEKRVDFVWIVDCVNGNPNGDPDANNAPRTDIETGMGLITDVCLKRKIRNFIATCHGDESGFGIYVKDGEVLELINMGIYKDLGIKPSGNPSPEDMATIKKAVCDRFFDIRAFGGVMNNKNASCGDVRGPVVMYPANSVDPVIPVDLTITRCCRSTVKEVEKSASGAESGTFGDKSLIPYGIYVACGQVIPAYAEKTGFSDGDLEKLIDGMVNCWDVNRSASSGIMSTRKLITFTHSSMFGNCQFCDVLDSVTVSRKEGITVGRSFKNYDVTIDRASLPGGIEVTEIV